MNQSETECCVVASCLCTFEHPWAPQSMDRPGPNVCTVLANRDYFESVEARIVAEAIGRCEDKGWRITRKNVRRLMGSDHKWLDHPIFSESNSLPLSVAEVEAWTLLPIYHQKRITQTIADAYSKCIDRPDKARTIAQDLKLQLEAVL